MSFKVVENGVFREDTLIKKLKKPAEIPGRNLSPCHQVNV